MPEILAMFICLRLNFVLIIICETQATTLFLHIFFLITFYQIINYANRFENEAILLIHFSARYELKVSVIFVGLVLLPVPVHNV